MKKLFISCPMRGRTEENIKKSMEKMHKIAEIIFDQELEVIPTIIEKDPPKNTVNDGLWYLGKSIQLLSKADYFIGVNGYSEFYRGCNAEQFVADSYNIPSFNVDMRKIMPDAIKVEQDYYDSMIKREQSKVEIVPL